jgi:hypothetical protein
MAQMDALDGMDGMEGAASAPISMPAHARGLL